MLNNCCLVFAVGVKPYTCSCRPALPVFIRGGYELHSILTSISACCLLVSYQLLRIGTSALNKGSFFPLPFTWLKGSPPPSLLHTHTLHDQSRNLATATVRRGKSGHFCYPPCCLHYLPRHIPYSSQTARTHTQKGRKTLYRMWGLSTW